MRMHNAGSATWGSGAGQHESAMMERPAPSPRTAPATMTTASGPWAALSQDARTGTVGVYSNSTSVATKVNTPLVNIPQSVSVLTKDFIKDPSRPHRSNALCSWRCQPSG
jgi:outer membrane receptor for ferric coprogen and ferric-rhodotorulic acid